MKARAIYGDPLPRARARSDVRDCVDGHTV